LGLARSVTDRRSARPTGRRRLLAGQPKATDVAAGA
jgi:hypothetical protein